MISLFKSAPNIVRHSRQFPKFNYIRSRIEENMERVVTFNELARRRVSSDHILVRLVESVYSMVIKSASMNLFDVIEKSSVVVGNSLGIASPIYTGTFFNESHFYGKNSQELLFINNEFNLNDVGRDLNWKEIIPIKVWVHPRTDISYVPLDPSIFSSKEKGYSVIEIDVNALVYMYIQFVKEQESLASAQTDGVLGTGHFIAMYILPSMLYSHLDVAWTNRLFKDLLGKPIEVHYKWQPLALPTSETYMGEVIKEINSTLVINTYHYDAILMLVPGLFRDTYDRVRLPKLPTTLPVKGFNLLATLPWIEYLLHMDSLSVGSANTMLENELRIALTRLKQERWLQSFRGNFDQVYQSIETNINPFLYND